MSKDHPGRFDWGYIAPVKAVMAIALASLAGAAAGPAIHVAPGSVHRGGLVRVYGDVSGGCARGDTVTLISRAFSRRHEFAGVPATFAVVHAGGKFSKRTRVP